MLIFPRFNEESVCSICKTNEQKPSVLIPIGGTESDGNCEALQVHLDCIDLHVRVTDRNRFLMQLID